ncbi:protein enabled homolog [Dermacentor silvarum]|uniref:protein enabled homolog n=1 Tax=Dermacentor silvarum TaxID=543639 RepID=UPI00189BB115|nr:protein enabled homolog [Dermacentor silvarum]
MDTPSNEATAEPEKANTPNADPPPLRPALKPPPVPPPPRPVQGPSVATTALPMKAAIGAATTVASTAAHVAVSAAASLGSLVMLKRNTPAGSQGADQLSPAPPHEPAQAAGGDQRQAEPGPPAELESPPKPATTHSPREKRKWRALRAVGNPMQSTCVALLVLCVLLVVGLLVYLLLFAPAEAAVGGAHQHLPARPNITADADTTTEALLIVLPTLGGATDNAGGGDRNNAAGNGSAEGASTIK